MSEDLKNDFRTNGQDLLGYDEYDVLRDLIKLFDEDNYQIVVKKHPTEKENKYECICDRLKYLDQIKVEDLSLISSKIIGMMSMLLIELSMYRNDIISYRPKAKDSFIGDEIGVIIKATDIDSIKQALHKKSITSVKFKNSFIGSRERILNYLNKT